MAIDQDTLEKLRSESDVPALDLSWLDLDNVWGVRERLSSWLVPFLDPPRN